MRTEFFIGIDSKRLAGCLAAFGVCAHLVLRTPEFRVRARPTREWSGWNTGDAVDQRKLGREAAAAPAGAPRCRRSREPVPAPWSPRYFDDPAGAGLSACASLLVPAAACLALSEASSIFTLCSPITILKKVGYS